MLVSFCLFKYFPHGGLQRDMVRIARECQRRGCEIRVYTLVWDGPVPEGFDICLVPVRAGRNHMRAKKFSEWVQNDLAVRPASVVVGFNKMPGLDVYYAADACYKEKSLTQRGPLYRLGGRYRQYTEYEKAVFSTDSKTTILMISRTQEPFFVRHYGTPQERMVFLPPNVSRERIAPPDADQIRKTFREEQGFDEETHLLVQIGSGFIKKGVDRSIRALASLPLDLRTKTTLWVIGKDHSVRFKRMARRLGVSDQVVFTGGRDDISQILQGADLMIHPAYDENTGTVLVESVAAGLPVLCTEICGYSVHVKAADCGLTTPEPFDQAVLNHQLRELLQGETLPRLRENALRYAKSTDLYSMHERAADVIFEKGTPSG